MFFLMTTNLKDYLPEPIFTLLGLATVLLSVYMFIYAGKKGKIEILWFFIGLSLSFLGFFLMRWVIKEEKPVSNSIDTDIHANKPED